MPTTCPQCQKENTKEAAQCASCGAPLVSTAALQGGGQTSADGRLERAARWGYRAGAAVLVLALVAAHVKLWGARSELRQARTHLEHARRTIQDAVAGRVQLPEMSPVPPDGQAARVSKKLAGCLVEEVTFTGPEVAVRISNPSGIATRPFVRVVLFSAQGFKVSDGEIVAYRTRSLASAEAKTLTERVRMPDPRPCYFLVTDH